MIFSHRNSNKSLQKSGNGQNEDSEGINGEGATDISSRDGMTLFDYSTST